MNKQPLLSICIPTYNRADKLKQTLESIVSQPEFIDFDEFEIVISDNGSKDGTKEICEELKKKYGNKILYSRNEKTIHSSENFQKVLSLAHGDFLKLHNDTLLIQPNGLTVMLDVAKKYKSSKPLVFFSPSVDKETSCKSLNEFVATASYYSTWIGGFCLWKEQSEYFDMFVTRRDCRLAQTCILCDIVAKQEKAIILNSNIFSTQAVNNKGKSDGYNIAEVFGYNYLNILKEYISKGCLSKEVYEKEKKNILLKHINYFYFDLDNQYTFSKTGYLKWLLPDYKTKPYFWLAYIKIRSIEMKRLFNYIFSANSIKCSSYKKKTIKIFGIKITFKKKRKYKI